MKRLLCAAFLLLPTAAQADYPTYTPEDYASLECSADAVPIWNDDYISPAPMCALKVVIEFQSVTIQCAYGSAEHCLELAEHVMKHYMPCFENAAKLEQG